MESYCFDYKNFDGFICANFIDTMKSWCVTWGREHIEGPVVGEHGRGFLACP